MEIIEKFKKLDVILSSKDFLNGKSPRSDVPYFISDYDPQKEINVYKSIKQLINKLDTKGIKVLEINLYELVCEILESKKSGAKIYFKMEKKTPKEKFKKRLQSSLNLQEVFIPKLKGKIDNSEADIYFLTGIGLVYPFIRTHNILTNLNKITNQVPMIIFFPGSYSGQTLKLFGVIKNDNYYRAYKI